MAEANRALTIAKGSLGYGEGWATKSITFSVEENTTVAKISLEKRNHTEVVISHSSGEFIANGEWIRIEIYENIPFNSHVVILPTE